MVKKTEVKKQSGVSRSAKKLKPADFVHLHNHTHYSLLDGLTKIPKLINYVKELGMEAVAITDHGTLSGLIEFYSVAKKAGIKPILGIETYVAKRGHKDKDPQKDKQNHHLVLLAMNNIGYHNLMRLSTIANLEGFYYRPRIDRELLEQYNEGLIVTSGCIGGEVSDALRRDQYQEAKEAALWYKSIFGDRYYFELQDHGHQWDEQKRVNDLILKLSKDIGVKCVITEDAHYLKHEDQEAHELLLCVQTGSYLSDQDRMSLKSMDLYIEKPEDIFKRWEQYPEAITNTKEVADRCDVTIELGNILIPKYNTPKGETEKTLLRKLAYQGLVRRYGGADVKKTKILDIKQVKSDLSDEVVERAEFELDTISKMGFDGYFLIVSDFVNWGKDRGIIFGPGRGSAAGSIISYALNITELDPIKYGLLFERFLNPERISMPDIDIDIQDNRRDEVIQYTIEKYGKDRVANIVTFGTMAGRAAIRDVARVLEMPYAEADRLAKLVPPPVQGRHTPLSVAIKKDPDFKEAYSSDEQAKRVIDLAIIMEGTIRSHGVHAAGVVIAPDDIVKFTPLEMSQKGSVTTQYSMGPIEELGLLKMDFLGLSNLTIIKNAIRIVKKVYSKDIILSDIPLNDEKTFGLLSQGDTTGIFQLESSGMKRYIRELKPDFFEDIVAMVALYRPGPLTAGLTDKYIARKNGLEAVTYDHEKMRSALESTYGVLVYQEQVMQIAKDLSGFSGGQADTLRKAIGKKKRDVMAKMKQDFIEGAIKTSGADKKFVEEFWKSLEGFADYAFNKSHAACYGLIAYWTAYLKAHYPNAFMAALMTSNHGDSDKLAIDIAECRRMDLDVLAPDVNESFLEFAVVPGTNKIRFGMAAIKNVGSGAVEEIIRAREEGGKFESIEDFASRVSTRIVNRKTWESLAKSGAFDDFHPRDHILHNMDRILAFGSKSQKDINNGQSDLFGSSLKEMMSLDMEKPPSMTTEKEQLQWERELLGLYLSNHPLEPYRIYLDEQVSPISKLTVEMDGAKVEIGGIVTTCREIMTKKGQKMAFVGIEDFAGELEMIVFPGVYNDNSGLFEPDAIIKVSGKLNAKDKDGRDSGVLKLLVDDVSRLGEKDIESYKSTGKRVRIPRKKPKRSVPEGYSRPLNTKSERVFIRIEDTENTQQLFKLKQVLNKHPGAHEAILVLGEKKNAVKLPFKVDISNGLEKELKDLLDNEAVVIK